MLSPCVRQVTHALLTRPPLTFESLGFIKSPFDLHVLSTPPAFILSQDQTLMLKSLSCQFYLALLFCLGGFSSSRSQILFSICFSEISRWVVFVQLSFGIFQGCIVVHFSRFKFCSLLLFSAATLLSYHRYFALSTTFLNFFKTFWSLVHFEKYHFSRWSLIISHQRFICQQLFQFIFYVAVILSDWIFSLNRTFIVYLKLFHLSTENFILFNISGCCYFSSTYYRRKRTLWWKKMEIHKNPLSLNLEDLLLVE